MLHAKQFVKPVAAPAVRMPCILALRCRHACGKVRKLAALCRCCRRCKSPSPGDLSHNTLIAATVAAILHHLALLHIALYRCYTPSLQLSITWRSFADLSLDTTCIRKRKETHSTLSLLRPSLQFSITWRSFTALSLDTSERQSRPHPSCEQIPWSRSTTSRRKDVLPLLEPYA